MKINSGAAKVKFISAMLVFGTIGLFVREIAMPSSVIALVRGAVGALFLLLVMLIGGKRPSAEAIKANLPLLCVSGAAMGFNWILLFEAYRFTTVATATLCYYLAPVFVIAAAPFVLKEKFTLIKALCIGAALAGMVLVSGVTESGFSVGNELKGAALGVGAAALYACVMLLNKRMKNISGLDTTFTQLCIAAAVLLPYVLLTVERSQISLDFKSTAMLFLVSVVHTGICYALYFSSMQSLSAQSIAVFSYIDPVTALILSALVLNEALGLNGIIGSVLILGSALISELWEYRIKKK